MIWINEMLGTDVSTYTMERSSSSNVLEFTVLHNSQLSIRFVVVHSDDATAPPDQSLC